MKPWAFGLLCSLFIGAGHPAAAQLSDDFTVCLIEPMPELPGGGGMAAIAAAVGRRVVYPLSALRAGAEGRVFVRFAVTPAGYVRNVSIVKAFRHDCGLAAVNSVRQLPRFRPRRQSLGEIKFTLPLSFHIEADKPSKPRPVRKKVPLPSAVLRRSAVVPAKKSILGCYFEPQPELLTGGGGQAIVAAVRQRLIYPPYSGLVCLTGRTFVKFTITPGGEVKQAVVVKGLWSPFDSAAVNAVRQLPCFKPMSQAMLCVVPVLYSR
jgi:TonB family protein